MAYQAALRKVFIEEGEDIRPLVPVFWKYYFDGKDTKSRTIAWEVSFQNTNPAFRAADAPHGEVSPPRPTKTPAPTYNAVASSHHIEGTSRLGAVIDNNGTTASIAILEPLGMGLDEEAVQTVERWKFQPGVKDGHPVRVQIHIDLDFRCCP